MRSRLIWHLFLLGPALIFISCDPDFPVNVSNPTNVSEITSNQTFIQFSVPTPSFVAIILQNMAGDDVRTLFAESVQVGYYSVNVNLSGLEHGRFYFITVKNGSDVRSFLIKLV